MSGVQFYSPTVPNPLTGPSPLSGRSRPGKVIPRRPPELRPHTPASSYFRAGAYDAAKVLSTQPRSRWYDPTRTGYELPDNESYRYASPFGYTSRYYGGEPYYSQRPPYYVSTFPGGFFLLCDPCEIRRWQDPDGGARTPEIPAMSRPVMPRSVTTEGPAPAVSPEGNGVSVPAPAPAVEAPSTPSATGDSL
jgi:hypothetical protein